MGASKKIYLLGLLAKLPFRMTQALGNLVGLLMYLFPNRERRFAEWNLLICFPNMSQRERSKILLESMQQTAKTLLEIPGVLSTKTSSWVDRVRIGEGQELIEKALKSEKGVIAAGPHLGNWEVGAQYLATLAPLTCLYRPNDISVIDSFINKGRQSVGADIAPTSNKGVRTLFAALKNKELVLILCDQEPGPDNKGGSVWAPFFNHPAQTMLLINRLARKTDATVLFWYMERLEHGQGFRINWLAAPDGVYSEDPVVAASALNHGVEQCIMGNMRQYMWSYKRFLHRPDGSKFSYRDRSFNINKFK